jgi:aspartyl-tRNA(Asn)/glutamyl-tRNA(Gln) amidotransferase subunit A
MFMQINQLTIKEASELLTKKEITSVELTKACLARIKEVDGKIKACLTVCEESALAEAAAADKQRETGKNNDLLGIPYLAKDNILTKGVKTTAASKILENYIAPYDATVITRLKKAGAIMLGKTNLDEFAHGSSTENSAFGPTHNPWDLDRVPGGSSGGSAAAVAVDMCLFALGTDTGGSVRYPAGFCGITGTKPTYGRASRFGLMAMTSSTDVPGLLTKSAEDASLVLQAIAGADKQDATTVDMPVSNYTIGINDDVKKIKIGLPKEYFSEGVENYVKESIESAKKVFAELDVEFVEVSLPHTKYTIPVYYIITPSEISSNLARFDGVRYGFSSTEASNVLETYTKSRGQGFGPEAKRRIMLGTYALSAGYYDAYYLQAQKVRTIIKNEMDKVLEKVDCLLTPTAPHIAFKIGENSKDPLKMYLEDVFMVGASLAGLPAISIPVGFYDSLPIGMQLIGKRFTEQKLFTIAHNFQKLTNYHKQKPNL